MGNMSCRLSYGSVRVQSARLTMKQCRFSGFLANEMSSLSSLRAATGGMSVKVGGILFEIFPNGRGVRLSSWGNVAFQRFPLANLSDVRSAKESRESVSCAVHSRRRVQRVYVGGFFFEKIQLVLKWSSCRLPPACLLALFHGFVLQRD